MTQQVVILRDDRRLLKSTNDSGVHLSMLFDADEEDTFSFSNETIYRTFLSNSSVIREVVDYPSFDSLLDFEVY